MKKFIVVLLLFLTACASENAQPTTENYTKILNSWLGREKSELISIWGNPAYDYQKGNKNYVVYVRNKMQAVAQGNKIERMPLIAKEKEGFFSNDESVVNKNCSTLFIVTKGKISAWRFDGNDCLAY